MSIAKPLKALLNSLERLSEEHDEIFDTDVREELSEAVYGGFIEPNSTYQLPKTFEMFSDEGDAAVRRALAQFLAAACPIADELGWTKTQRLSAFQDLEVTSREGLTYDEFFGHSQHIVGQAHQELVFAFLLDGVHHASGEVVPVDFA